MPRDPLEALRLPVVPIEPRPEFATALWRRIQAPPAPSEWSPGPSQSPPAPSESPPTPHAATVRYFVDDMDAAVAFYCRALGFEEELRPAPAFAMLYRGDLRLLLSLPTEPHALGDGTLPVPGAGFNRMSLRVRDLAATVDALRGQGVSFATPLSAGPTVHTVLVRDPAGNLVELFQPRGPGYHERPSTHAEEGS
jgi:catechol 2,3-dioxygenase-like lactoylglutathione lyase family enzyme